MLQRKYICSGDQLEEQNPSLCYWGVSPTGNLKYTYSPKTLHDFRIDPTKSLARARPKRVKVPTHINDPCNDLVGAKKGSASNEMRRAFEQTINRPEHMFLKCYLIGIGPAQIQGQQ